MDHTFANRHQHRPMIETTAALPNVAKRLASDVSSACDRFFARRGLNRAGFSHDICFGTASAKRNTKPSTK